MRKYNPKMPDLQAKCADDWNDYMMTQPTIYAAIVDTFNIRVTGHVMGLKKYIETESFGVPRKFGAEEPEWGYLITNADEDMTTEAMENLSQICNQFNYLLRTVVPAPAPSNH